MRASDVALFGRMKSFGGGPAAGVSANLDDETGVAGSAESAAPALVDRVRGIVCVGGWWLRDGSGSELPELCAKRASELSKK